MAPTESPDLRLPHVVHVSADYPDPIVPDKTPVIRSLIGLTSGQFRHEVISLNRRAPGGASLAGWALSAGRFPRLDIEAGPFDAGLALSYRAPARGLFHAALLRQLGDWLADRLATQGRPDLLVAHKLTIEGLAVAHAARRLRVPYAISIQGNTDTRVISARPDLRGRFTRIFHEAAVVFPFAPWALRRVEQALGPRSGPVRLLPCPTELDQPLTPRPGGSGLISVFHLRNAGLKNLARMACAIDRVQAPGACTLAIIGGGREEDIARSRAMAGGSRHVVFEGPLGREALSARMNGAIGFVLPSLRESFGLVFIEALFAGLPIIYPAGAAIDGYFDDAAFALRVDAGDANAIARAMERLILEEAELKSALAQWHASGDSARFARQAIAGTFAEGLRRAIEGHASN